MGSPRPAKDLAHDGRVGEQGDEAAWAATVGACEGVDGEDAAQKLGPGGAPRVGAREQRAPEKTAGLAQRPGSKHVNGIGQTLIWVAPAPALTATAGST